jgi:hypothetical protein
MFFFKCIIKLCQSCEGKSFKIRIIFYLCWWIANFRNVVNLHRPQPPVFAVMCHGQYLDVVFLPAHSWKIYL